MPLGRRAWIGDGRHGASVATDGTIDWYCSGGVSSEPDLWRLLDPDGAAVRVGPVREGDAATRRLPSATQRYRERTNVLETIMDGPAGRRVAVVDFMPWTGPGLEVPGRVVRLVRALSGPVDVELEVVPGPRRLFGGSAREVAVAGRRLVCGSIEVNGPAEFTAAPVGDDERWRAVVRLDAGEQVVVDVGPRTTGSGVGTGLDAALRMLASTEVAWRSWIGPLYYAGPYRPAVERALLAIRSLTGAGGAPIGAGTSSLPRRVGSERSHDARWVRLRDAARAVRVLADSGLAEDAEACETWLRSALTDAPVPWPGWLDPDGQPVPEPEEWPFPGWRRSQPVTAGRAPVGADIGLAGAVVGAVGASTSGPGGRTGDPGPLSAARPALAAEVDWAVDHWREPDSGRWEIDRPRRLYVASRLDAGLALDRMARLARAANPLDLDAVGWQRDAKEVLEWVEANGVAADGGLRIDPGPSDEPDAALLAVAWSGPWPPSHPIVVATVDRVLERLAAGPLIHRYSERVADERAGPDNPDLESSLGAAKALACLSRWEDAHERLEAVLGLIAGGNVSETADPVSGELFGNFPDTAAGLALVDAALALAAGPR